MKSVRQPGTIDLMGVSELPPELSEARLAALLSNLTDFRTCVLAEAVDQEHVPAKLAELLEQRRDDWIDALALAAHGLNIQHAQATYRVSPEAAGLQKQLKAVRKRLGARSQERAQQPREYIQASAITEAYEAGRFPKYPSTPRVRQLLKLEEAAFLEVVRADAMEPNPTWPELEHPALLGRWWWALEQFRSQFQTDLRGLGGRGAAGFEPTKEYLKFGDLNPDKIEERRLFLGSMHKIYVRWCDRNTVSRYLLGQLAPSPVNPQPAVQPLGPPQVSPHRGRIPPGGPAQRGSQRGK